MKNYFVFQTINKNKYLFDNNTGFAVPYTKIDEYIISNFEKVGKIQMYSYLNKKFKISKMEFENRYFIIENYRSMGIWVDKREPRYITREQYFRKLKRFSSSQLVLIITNECNMRCKYCVYSDMYPNTITYSSSKMDIKVAKKAIKYYMELYEEKFLRGYRKAPLINFYGGEPLLEYNLIKDVVQYVKNNYKREVEYYITTNGLLLNEEISNFFIKSEFRVTVSLDGDRLNHDRNRVTKDSRGTHGIIMENLGKYFGILKSMNEDRKPTLSFNCCFDDYSSANAIINFFEGDSLLKDKEFYVFFSQINPYDDTKYYDFCDECAKHKVIKSSRNTWKTEMQQIFNDFANSIKLGKNISEIEKSLFSSYYFFRNRTLGQMPNTCNSCIPGSKIAVNAKGDFFICERMGERFPIGNVDIGLDWGLIKLLFEQFFHLVETNCSDCKVSKMCQLCFMHLSYGKKNELEFNKPFCEITKKQLGEFISNMYGILEINPDAFKGEAIYGTEYGSEKNF